jgi:hypothetical protein
VYLHDQVPVFILHILEANVSQNAGIVDENIDSPKVLNGSLDDGITIFDAVVVGDGLTTSFSDLVDNDICGLGSVS